MAILQKTNHSGQETVLFITSKERKRGHNSAYVKFLIKNGCNVNSTDHGEGRPALRQTILTSHAKLVDLLLL